MPKCSNHLPKLTILEQKGRYEVIATWSEESGMKNHGYPEASFFSAEVEGSFVLKRHEYGSNSDFGIAQSEKEAQHRLKLAALEYVAAWKAEAENELHEVKTQTGRWHPDFNHPSYRTPEYISRLERDVAGFECNFVPRNS